MIIWEKIFAIVIIKVAHFLKYAEILLRNKGSLTYLAENRNRNSQEKKGKWLGQRKDANQKCSAMAFVTYQIGKDQNIGNMLGWWGGKEKILLYLAGESEWIQLLWKVICDIYLNYKCPHLRTLWFGRQGSRKRILLRICPGETFPHTHEIHWTLVPSWKMEDGNVQIHQ